MEKQTRYYSSLEDLPDILDAHMIAIFLDIGYVKALNLIKYGDIPYIKLGNTYRVPKTAFEAWLSVTNPRVIKL